MRYLHVEWKHSDPDEPVELYSELDDAAWETRKIELFRDGSVGFADKQEEFGPTLLSETPLPPIKEIAADPEFEPMWIEKDQFEKVWAERRSRIVHAVEARSSRANDDKPSN